MATVSLGNEYPDAAGRPLRRLGGIVFPLDEIEEPLSCGIGGFVD